MKKGWRTLLVAIVTALFGVLESFDFTNLVTGKNASYIILILGVVFGWLRSISTTALGEPEV